MMFGRLTMRDMPLDRPVRRHWTAAVLGLRAGHRSAFFPAWFLAIASIANGIAHPLLAVRVGGYFPGLLTAPLVGIAGGFLWACLMAMTHPNPATPPFP